MWSPLWAHFCNGNIWFLANRGRGPPLSVPGVGDGELVLENFNAWLRRKFPARYLRLSVASIAGITEAINRKLRKSLLGHNFRPRHCLICLCRNCTASPVPSTRRVHNHITCFCRILWGSRHKLANPLTGKPKSTRSPGAYTI